MLGSHSRWMSSTSPFSSLEILRYHASSAGDVLRDLEKRNLITGDFVLISGDVIGNVDLDSAITQHRARREKNKNAIMTMVLREVGRDYRSKPSSRRPFFFIDPSENRCLHYEEINVKDRGDRRFHLDDELLAKPEIDVRGDLLDCYIDICTPDVLGLWSDNFDYKSIRSSFLRGVLQDYELNGKTIHTCILDTGYIARVSSLRAYDAISRDIIDRWSFPFTPDSNLMPGHNYRLSKNKVYTEGGVVLARGSSVQSRSIIGKDTSVGDRSVVSNSVLGRRCQIGKNVRIENSYLWDDVVVGDNSTIIGAMVADEVVVGSDCTVSQGSLLSFRVRLSKGIELPSKTILTDIRDDFIQDKFSTPDISLVGAGGAGRIHEADSDASEASNALLSSTSRRMSSDSLESMSTLHSDIESGMDLSDGNHVAVPLSPTDSTHGNKTFFAEAITSIQDGVLKNDDPDTVKLELLGQRLTHNASDKDMRDAIARALIRSVFTFINPPRSSTSSEALLSTSPSTSTFATKANLGSLEGITPKEAVAKVYDTYSPILVQLGLFDSALPEKSDQVAVLREIEQECAIRREIIPPSRNHTGQEVLLFALNQLHSNLDVLQDEGVLQWWDGGVEGEIDPSEDISSTEIKIKPRGMEVRRLAATYMDSILLGSDEETDSEEDEDEEEDESE